MVGDAAADVTLATRVVEGPGSVARVGELVRELGERALLVTDGGLVEAGHAARAEELLRAAGVSVSVYSDVNGDPTTDDVERCLEVARELQPDVWLGFGGGSSIDTAKGANFLLCCGGRMQDYWGVGKATADLLPLVAVPTTAGTGTEVQSFALIADAETHQKMACGDRRAAPRVALLDPELTVTVPPFVTACTGLDAIGHAVETAVTTKRSRVSVALSREAFALAARAFSRVLEAPGDVEARGRMLRAATLAGRAIENSMLGAAHALANPLTARFGVPHGLAVGLMLPFVVRYNAEDEGARRAYAELAREAGLCAAGESERRAAEALAARLGELLRLAGLPTTLEPSGVGPGDCALLGAEAETQWTATFNPRPVDASALTALYERALR